jgi:Calx-beta domain/SdrD B-like domain/Dockerin type I domain
VLESRELLAGDVAVTPWHNSLMPADVNFDQRVSPIDALVIINDLLANGSHAVDVTAAAPLSTTSSTSPVYYRDTSGDNRVTPLDLLIVINELVDGELMLVHTFPTDMADNPITTINVGTQFKLRTEVQDIRAAAPNPGVFSAGADVSFDSGLFSIDTGQTVQFDPLWSLVSQSTLVAGRVITYGAATAAPNTNQPQFLSSVVLTATSSGTQIFTPIFDTTLDHDYSLVGIDPKLMVDEVRFEGAMLEVTAPPMLSIGSVSQNEDSGTFNFTVSLAGTATENVTVAFATSDGSGQNAATLANSDYVANSGTLTFTPGGATTMVIPVTVNADVFVEPDEVFNVTLSNISASATIGTAVGVGTILNDDTQATLAIGNVQRNEDSPGTFDFTVTISGEYTQNVTVNFSTNDGTATVADSDYVAASGTLTFTPGGATTMVVPVTVNADSKVEPNETFNVSLSNPSGNAVIGTPLGVGTIVNDDVLASLSIGSTTVNNVTTGTTTANFTVTLSEATTGPVMVAFATSDNSAIAGVDYESTSGTLNFTPGGSLTATFPVTIIGDPLPDDVETFLVALSNPVNASINVGQATGMIIPAVSEPAVSISDVTLPEGALGGTTDFVFTITLSGPSSQNAVVAYETADGTATVGNSDYVAKSATITFTPGQTSRTVTVQVTGDNTAEPTETFLVNVNAVSGSTGNAQGIGTIVDDDGAPTLTISDAVATPGTGVTEALFTVTLSGKVTQPVSVGFATADDTAMMGVDYLAVSGNLTFTPGGLPFQVIPVTVLGRSSPQADKTFFMTLSSQTPGDVVLGDDLGIGTIITQGLSIGDAVVVEGNSSTASAIFTVMLSRMSSETVTVFYSTADGTATTANSDYVPTSGTLTFAPGVEIQMITVSVVGDTSPEANEQFSVNLSAASGAPLFNSQGIGTIINDDGDKVAIRLELADAVTETPLPINAPPLNMDDEFLLRVFVRDVQPEPTGVAQVFLDVTFQSNLVEPVGNPVFGPFYDDTFSNFAFGDGLLDDFGAFGGIGAPADPSEELLLFKIKFKATANGLVEFVGSVLAEDLNQDHETLLYFPAPETPVPADEINIENRSINIGSNVLTVSNVSAPESNNLVFSITRFLPDNTTATVMYSTANGTAVAGQDYVAKSGTLTFIPGQPTTQTVTVVVTNDTLDEPDETMSLVLSDAVNATQGLPGTGTIQDDDGPVSVSASNSSAAEGANLVFTVSLSAASGKTVTVNYATADPPSGIVATAGVDYTPTSGSLTFSPGVTQQLVTVALLNDILFESNETFRLALSAPQNASLGTPGLGTIIDVPPAGISGFVYVDLNNNGIKDANEVGIPGVIVTATRNSDGSSETQMTREDGSYVFVGLFPDTYTIKETQPGFYTDGRDVHLGVESTANDQFSGVVLAPSAAETGYNFGELGVRSEFIAAFINRRALFATAAVGGLFGPTINMPGATLNLSSGDIWVSFDGGWNGLRTIEAVFQPGEGTATMRLYNNSLQEVALSAPTLTGALLLFNGQIGAPYFLRISGSNPDVTVQISESVLPGGVSAPAVGGDADQGNPPTQTSSSNSNSDPLSPTGRFASTQPMIAPEIEPLVSSDASDEALSEGEDWILETLLA